MGAIVEGYVLQWLDAPMYYLGLAPNLTAQWSWDKTKAQRWATGEAAAAELATWAIQKYVRVVPLVRGEGSA